MSFPKEYYDVYSLVTNENTAKHIKLTTINLEKLLNKKFTRWSYATFLNKEEIDKKFENLTMTAKIHSLSVIKRFLKYKRRDNTELYRLYNTDLNEVYERHNLKREEQKKTTKETESWMSYQDMKKHLVEFIPKYLMSPEFQFYRFRDLIILSFYILQTPVRLGNLAELKFVRNPEQELRHYDKKFNYLSKDGNKYKLVYNQYKTQKRLGQLEFIIKNQLLINLLDKYLSYFFKNNSEHYLFTKKDQVSKLSTVSLEQAIRKQGKKHFNKPDITLNLIRHSFFTDFFKTNPSIKEQRRVALEAGHKYTASMSIQYARLD